MSNNCYHLRTALMGRLEDLATAIDRSKTDIVNEAVDRYINDEMMRIAMSRHRDQRQSESSLKRFANIKQCATG